MNTYRVNGQAVGFIISNISKKNRVQKYKDAVI